MHWDRQLVSRSLTLLLRFAPLNNKSFDAASPAIAPPSDALLSRDSDVIVVEASLNIVEEDDLGGISLTEPISSYTDLGQSIVPTATPGIDDAELIAGGLGKSPTSHPISLHLPSVITLPHTTVTLPTAIPTALPTALPSSAANALSSLIHKIESELEAEFASTVTVEETVTVTATVTASASSASD